MTLVPAPGFDRGDLSREGNLAAHVDRLLLPGHLYFFRALTVGGGYADISTGDLSTIALPYAVAQHDGGVFTVNL